MSMMTQKALEKADNRFFAKIILAKQTTIQDKRTDDEVNDMPEQNEEPPD